MSILEVVMMVCFGAAWPVSLAKSYKSRTAAGKSWFFSAIVLVGYTAGILHKVFYSPDFVIALYALNFTMVAVDLMLWVRNHRFDRAREAAQAAEKAGT